MGSRFMGIGAMVGSAPKGVAFGSLSWFGEKGTVVALSCAAATVGTVTNPPSTVTVGSVGSEGCALKLPIAVPHAFNSTMQSMAKISRRMRVHS